MAIQAESPAWKFDIEESGGNENTPMPRRLQATLTAYLKRMIYGLSD